MIRLDGAAKRYGERTALHPTTIEFEKRVTALIGASGSGKSTILRLVAGLIAPSEGTVEVDGKLLTKSTATEIRRKIGYVIQEGGLFPHLSARQNVELMAKKTGKDPGWRTERVAQLADLVRLPHDLLDSYPAELSGGQRQRVSLMRALVLDPEYLLLDEPLGALDPLVRAALQQDLKEMFQRIGRTVLLVTHDLAEAAFLAPEDIVLLREGSIVQRDSFAALNTSPNDAYVTEFIAAQRSLTAIQ